MKNKIKAIVSALLPLVLIALLAACRTPADAGGLWESATYRADTALGDGGTTVFVEVKAGDTSVTFTVKTDRAILGDALLDCGLIAGEAGPYGLNVTVVNGMTADYSVDQCYWAFYKDGEYMMVGVDGAEIAAGEHYELVYSR